MTRLHPILTRTAPLFPYPTRFRSRLVGEAPVDLQQPPQLPNLPASTEDAVAIALTDNPDIEAADQRLGAARADIGAARAARMPKLDGTVSGSYTNFLGSLSSEEIGRAHV